MKIELMQFVNHSGFKKYHFIVDAKNFNDKEELNCKEDDVKFIFDRKLIQINPLGVEQYELAKCLNLEKINASITAYWLDRCRFLEFDFFECDSDECYFHFKKRRFN